MAVGCCESRQGQDVGETAFADILPQDRFFRNCWRGWLVCYEGRSPHGNRAAKLAGQLRLQYNAEEEEARDGSSTYHH